MIPSTNMQECTIDASDEKVWFSCVVDGNEAVQAWRIIIYNLDDGAQVFDSKKVDLLTEPFFPVDEKNRNVVFSVDIKEHLKTDATFIINRKQAYYWTITLWGTSGVSVKSCEEVFYASKRPTFNILCREDNSTTDTLLTEGAVLSSRSCKFIGSYVKDAGTQDGVQLKRYGWRLRDTSNGQILIDTITHNQIYGTLENMICNYNGFLNEGRYSVELYVETQDNTSIITNPINFTISYNTTFLDNDVRVMALDNEPSVMLNWEDAIVIGGRSEGEVSFETQYPIINYKSKSPSTSINIPEGSRIVFDYGASSNLDIDENCYVVLSTQLKNAADTTLFYAEGVDVAGLEVYRNLSFHNGRFEYSVGIANNIVSTSIFPAVDSEDILIPNQYVWYILTMSPMLTNENGQYYTELSVVESKLVNGTYPSSSLYPKADGVYPSAGVWDRLKEEVE